MGLRTVTPQRTKLGLWTLALLGVGLLSIVSISLLKSGTADEPASVSGLPAEERLAYLEFSRTADSVWTASADDPQRRQKLFVIEHAPEFGVVPSLAPDGRRFVYAALAPETKAPAPDTPADLWLAALTSKATPERIAGNADLLVRAVWAPDGRSLVLRRSTARADSAGDFRLVALDLATRTEHELLFSAGAAVFPLGFTPDGSVLYYVRVQSGASDLLGVDVATGAQRQIGRLADGLTRDWTLAPAGDRLAYLEMSFAAGRISSQAYVLELATGVAAPLNPERAGDEFSPVWSAQGDLAVGQVSGGEAGAGLLTLRDGGRSALAGPRRGFDVPLAWSLSGGSLAVRNFEGSSAMAPGRSVLAVIHSHGRRNTLTTGEVTFLGWINP